MTEVIDITAEIDLAALSEVTLKPTSDLVATQARSVVVRSQQDYDKACVYLKLVNATLDKAHELLDPECAVRHKAWKEKTEERHGIIAPLEEVKGALSGGIGAYDLQQQRLQQEAKRLADEESARLAEQMRESAALAAIDSGADDETVDAIQSMPVAMPRPISMAPTFRRAPGVSTRTAYKGEVVNMEALVKAAVDGNALAASILTVDESKLNALARIQGVQLMRLIPGVRVHEVPVVAASRRK
jgi:hypothetical protein